jgi:hypothetical protein
MRAACPLVKSTSRLGGLTGTGAPCAETGTTDGAVGRERTLNDGSLLAARRARLE